MTDFLTYLISGLSLGGLYGLLALGFVVLYRATEILNFAHGTMVLLGTYAVARFSGLGFWVAWLIGITVTVILAVVIQRLVLHYVKSHDALTLTVATIGLNIILITIARQLVGGAVLPIHDPWGSSLITVGEVILPLSRVIALVASAAIAVGFFVWLQRSAWGLAFRASTEKRDVAVLMGVNLNVLALIAWGLSGALAVVAGVFLSTFPTPGVSLDLASIALVAFPAAVIGGLNSPLGAIIGGLMVGVLQIMAQGYRPFLGFLGNGFDQALIYIVMIAVLLIRPKGLFGRKEVRRA